MQTTKEIIILYNDDEDMMEILANGTTIFLGNYWDFDKSPNGIQQFLKSVFRECEINIKTKKKKSEEIGR